MFAHFNFCLVDLRLVKEVRPGKCSPDFEKWSEEARRHDTNCCFVLFYGREFRLKTLSLAGLNYSVIYTVFQKSDAKIQITITTAHLIRINYPLSSFNYHLSGTNLANFNKIHRTVSEQQL